MKNNLTESDINRIVKRVMNEDLQESTWEGIKGWAQGKGYYYTKYLTELEYILQDMEKKIVYDRKLHKKISKLEDKVNSSSMEDDKKDYVNTMLGRTQKIIGYCDSLIQNELHNLKRLKNY
jgi:hypothetical protein